MTPPTASTNPDTFMEQIQEIVDQINQAIGDYLEQFARFINDHLTEIGAFLGAAAGGLVLPGLGHVVGGIGGGVFGAAIEGRFNDYCDRVSEAWQTTQEQIWDGIGSVFGNPAKMSTISSGYKDAVTTLGEVKGKVASADNYVDDYWKGRAFTAYQNTSRRQTASLQGMSDMLGDAADLLDDNQLAMMETWNNQIRNIWALYLEAGSAKVKMIEVENALTGGVKGIIELIIRVGKGVGDIVKEAVDYWLNLNVGSAGDWDTLQSKFGDRGLPGRKWPDLDTIDQGPLNGPWQTAS